MAVRPFWDEPRRNAMRYTTAVTDRIAVERTLWRTMNNWPTWP